MFKSGKDTMREFPTPERVFALCRYVKRNSYNREDLYQELCLGTVFGDGSKDIFGYTLAVAQELELITEIDGIYSITEEGKEIEDFITFRRYASRTALSRMETIFFKTTALYIKLAESAMKCKNWGVLLALYNKNGMDLSDNDMLGWRFWTSFFGIGYLHQQMLIPNCFIRFKDVLDIQESFKVGEAVPIEKFMLWLETQCPEIKESREGTKLGIAVSNALRTLEAQQIIELKSHPDAYRWQLYILESEELNDISHIQIVR